MKRALGLVAALVMMCVGSLAQSDPRPEILVLGTYHMANPGHDIYNMQADDVLSPKRQQEIAELLGILKKFHPTKIAIESDADGKRNQQYADYLAGKYTLTRNEIDQIGFQLAKELGQRSIYPVDVDGDFPLGRVTNYAKANGKARELDDITAGWGTAVKEQDAFLKTHTILQTLEYMNADSTAKNDVGLYYQLVRLGDSSDYAGADLLSAWYQRNIRIYQNIVKLIDSPGDKILVIYGAGHLGWLQQNIANDTSVRLRKLSDLTGE